MALNKDTVSINLAKGVNTNTDDKISSTDQNAVLENAVFDKDYRISKRKGLTAASTTVNSNLPAPTIYQHPPPIQANPGKSKVFAHEDQLMMENSGFLYSQLEGQNEWAIKGSYLPIDVSAKRVFDGITFTDSATINGVTILIGYDSISGYVAIVEEATGFVSKTQFPFGVSTPSSDINGARIVPFYDSNKCWIVYDIGIVPGIVLADEIDLTTGRTNNNVVTITNNQVLSGGFYKEITYTDSTSAYGQDANFIFYDDATDGPTVLAMFADGTLGPSTVVNGFATGGGSTTPSLNHGVAIHVDPSNPNQIYFAQTYGNSVLGVSTTSVRTEVASYTFTNSSYSEVYSGVSAISTTIPLGQTGLMTNPTLVINPRTGELMVFANTQIYLKLANAEFTNSITGTTVLSPSAADAIIYWGSVDGSGAITVLTRIYSRGLLIAAHAMKDAVRNTVYLPCIFYSVAVAGINDAVGFVGPTGANNNTSPPATQSAYVLVDVLQGRPGTVGNGVYPQGKWLYNGDITVPFSLSRCDEIADGEFKFTNSGNTVDIDLYPPNAAQSQYFARTSHLTGGNLWAYDGSTVSEHNFHFYPDQMDLYVGAGLDLIGTAGTPSTKALFQIHFGNAGALNVTSSAGTTLWYGFQNVAGTKYYVWYTVDGVGADPAPATRTGIRVAIASSYTAQEVAAATGDAIFNGSTGYVVTQNQPLIVITVNETNCANHILELVAATVGTTELAAAHNFTKHGQLSAGSYEWTVVWKWTDRNGNIYRSAPAVPIKSRLDVAGSDFASLIIWTPPITCRTFTDVHVEIYRTLVDGSTFHLLNSIPVTATSWASSKSRIQYTDVINDTILSYGEILYTDGGILENIGVGACSTVSFFKERLVVSGLVDDPYLVSYSKTTVVGEPVNFTAFTNFRIDNDVNPITAVQQLDGNLVVFKKSLIYLVSGDGANDLGAGSTFTPPQLMASNVGTENPNSVVLYDHGLMFKSNKGIWVYSRANAVSWIGSPVKDFDSFNVSGAVLNDSTTEIRYTLSDNDYGLVYNYFFNRWDYFTNYTADSACLWQDKFTLVRNNGEVAVESENYYDIDVDQLAVPYEMFCELPWLKLKGIQNFQRIYSLLFLGDYKSPHQLVFRIYIDYNEDIYEEFTFDSTSQFSSNPNQLVPGKPEQIQVYPANQRCEAMKVSIREVPGTGSQQSVVLNDCTAYVGLKKGPYKLPPKQRT